jgi:exopolyphosphatase / guanosine-5'-triphosphate,3'-diphosphate pyrophosphatase
VRLAVLDIGSNTVHSLVVDAHYGAAPLPAYKSKLELQLAQLADPDGVIAQETIDRLIGFIKQDQLTAEKLGVGQTIAFATSAIREAPNRAELCSQVNKATGLTIDVLSGEVEAELTFLAARRWVGWSAGRLMLFDIGGGSLELAVGDDEEPDHAVSLPLGAGLLSRVFITDDPPSPGQIKELRKHIRAVIAGSASKFSKGERPRAYIGTSKTFKQLARIAGAPESAAGIYAERTLTVAGVGQIIDRISPMTDQQRKQIDGVSAGRSGQMLAGALVAEAAMELFHAHSITICPWALREGVILRALDSMSNEVRSHEVRT